jgi:hypothetical protein
MKNTAETIAKEMKSRGIEVVSKSDVILSGIMLSLEDLTEKLNK